MRRLRWGSWSPKLVGPMFEILPIWTSVSRRSLHFAHSLRPRTPPHSPDNSRNRSRGRLSLYHDPTIGTLSKSTSIPCSPSPKVTHPLGRPTPPRGCRALDSSQRPGFPDQETEVRIPRTPCTIGQEALPRKLALRPGTWLRD
jgi:hypothetical protein